MATKMKKHTHGFIVLSTFIRW